MHALNSVIGLPESLVGGKSLRLAQMQLLGLRIKPAVVLDSAAVQSILTTGVVSNLVKEVVCKNLSSNGHGFAVRSSASGEDGDLSWAGQFKSLLFVSAKELDNAVLDCAAAIQSESVAVYAKIHGSESAQLALVIQEMVNAEMAGVLFTHNPVTLNDREMIVEVVAGVAEGLVSGQTEPHRYYIDAEDGTVLREEGVADPKLSNALIKELVTIGQILRESFGQGQDIEWAVEAGTGLLFINQSRNITTDNLACSMITLTSSLEQGLELEQDRLTNLGVSFPT
ncbi:MAG: PEP/pyruvate-binding domain-containing protein, partial [Patescibacteria group bacterium]